MHADATKSEAICSEEQSSQRLQERQLTSRSDRVGMVATRGVTEIYPVHNFS